MSEPVRLGLLNASGVPLQGRDPISGVYSVTNLANGARYIGSTINVAQRWAGHRATFRNGRVSVNARIAPDLETFGIDAFAVDLLEVVEPDDVALEVAERRWIARCAEDGAVYNIIMSGHREPVKARRPSPPRAAGDGREEQA